MRGKLVTVIMLLILIISACGKDVPTATLLPTQVETLTIPITGATATDPVVVTEEAATSTTRSEATSTSAPPHPTNLPDCTNSASFVTDVTTPDNSEVAGDSSFVKIWRVSNTGTCIWAEDYTVTYYSGERMSSPASVNLPLTYPGQTADISMELKAPNTVGVHKSYFVIKNGAGLIMKVNSDSRLWVIIDVKTAAAVTATSPSSAGATATTASGTSGNGFATVNCSYVVDPPKVTAVINAVNAYRAASGLTTYNVNSQLTLAAQAHANDMACNNLFGHTGSNGSTPQSRAIVSGYVASSVSENVYGSYPPLSGADVVDWWKNDKTDLNHNLNLINTKFADIGVGYSFYNNYGYYVIVFATP